MNLDYRLFEMVNRFAGQNGLLDQLVMLFSKFGPLFFGFVLIGLWFSQSKNKYKNRRIVLYALTIVIIALGINKMIELAYFRPRPFVTYAVNLLSDKLTTDPSFPSNHSTGGFALAMAIFYFRRKIGAVLLIIAFFLALSRMYIGVHFPLDLTAGAVIAFIVTVGVMSLRRYLDPVYKTIIQGKKLRSK